MLPWLRLNVSRSGPSVSVGPRGVTLTVGPSGTRATLGIPGTGLSVTKQVPFGRQRVDDRWSQLLDHIRAVLADQFVTLTEVQSVMALQRELGLADEDLPQDLLAIVKDIRSLIDTPSKRFILEFVEFAPRLGTASLAEAKTVLDRQRELGVADADLPEAMLKVIQDLRAQIERAAV